MLKRLGVSRWNKPYYGAAAVFGLALKMVVRADAFEEGQKVCEVLSNGLFLLPSTE